MKSLRPLTLVPLALLLSLLAAPSNAASPAPIKGSFVLGGVDAGLKHVRAAQVTLAGDTAPGYVALLSARPATGDLASWQTADPAERGNFVWVQLEKPKGTVWIAELGHTTRKSGRFGIVLELETVSFEVRDNRLKAHLRTRGNQTFGDHAYSVDLTFEADLEAQ